MTKLDDPIQGSYLELEKGVKLHYIDKGQSEPEKPVFLMLHGNPTWSYYYRNLIHSCHEYARVIAVDHIGCGYSSKPQNYSYTLAKHISNLESLVTHLNLKKIILVLHDWGGAIGCGFGVQNPQLIQGIIVTNTAAYLSNDIPFRIRICKLPFIGTLINRGFNGFARAALSMAVRRGKKLNGKIARAYLEPYSNWNSRIAIDRFVQDIPIQPNHQSWKLIQSIENKLKSFQAMPSLILWGGQDFCFHRSFYERWLQELPAAESHYFDHAGHYLLEDAFDEIEPLIQSFYKQHFLHEC